jgi:peptidoglycan hydrolase CwlO-like protein
MNSSVAIELLLGALTVVVGFVSYWSSTRAAKAQSLATQADIDADAYNRAKDIYESAIEALKGNVETVREQARMLEAEVKKLRDSNKSLQEQVVELRVANARLEDELRHLRDAGK